MPSEASDKTGSPPELDTAAPTEEGAGQSFQPMSFMEALKSAVPRQRRGRPRPPRPKAQPATGTEEDAERVNFIDKRERLIASFLAAFQVVLGVVSYVNARHYVEHAGRHISVHQAHLDTINAHNSAPWLLVINLVLGLGIAGGVLSKRRALVGFTVILGGFAMNTTGGGYIGIIYLVIGMWLIFRAMKRNPRRPAPAGGGGSQRTERAAPAKGAQAKVEPRKPPAPSKRYTPPRATKRPPSRPPLRKEQEEEPGLRGWVSRKLGRDSVS